jgi:hypothetical protein
MMADLMMMEFDQGDDNELEAADGEADVEDEVWGGP